MRVIYVCWFLLFVLTLLLLGQSFRLQIIHGKENSHRAQQNRFRIQTIEAERGVFYDRRGKPLVENREGKRVYVTREVLSSVIGYTGEADEKDLELFCVDPGRKVGKMGLEREANGIISGTDGGMVEEISATGEKLRTFSTTNPVPGRSLQLTLDLPLQEKAYKLLKESGYKGAIVVSSTDSRLLALATYPSFDANIFSEMDEAKIQVLFEDASQPMFNRAIAGLYPPASTFKIVTAIAALESGAVENTTEIEDTGVIRVGEFSYSNWYFTGYGATDGMVNVTKALQRSNDIYFYKIGEAVGIEKIAEWGRTLGLGSRTGIRIEGEAQGLVPDKAWKQNERGEDWYVGDTYITAIGQGNLQVTPLQVNRMTSVVANHGWLCQPELVAAVVDKPMAHYQTTKGFEENRCQKIPVSLESIASVTEGMQKACEPGGTGWPLFDFKVINSNLIPDGKNYFEEASGSSQAIKIPVACKTGTAETGVVSEDGKDHKTHAWFTAFAPVEEPEVVVTVLLEYGGQGSDKAAPLARELLKQWFEGK